MKLVVALLSSVGLVIMSADGGGRIEGTVKATGLASNADAVVYVQQVAGKFPAPAKPADMDHL